MFGGIWGGNKKFRKWSINFYIAIFLQSFSIIAVNCFVFITGYFQIDKKEIKVKKIINLLLIVEFYYIVLYFVGIYYKNISFSIKSFIFTIIPLMKGELWFVWTYIILITLSPYLNRFLLCLSKKDFKKLLIIMLIFFSIIPTFIPWYNNNDNGYGIISFILIYSISAYIKIHIDTSRDNRYLSKWFISSFIVFILSLISFKLINGSNAWGYNNIFNIMSAMYLFLYFKNINIKSNIVNYLATYCFAIYIIHINPSISSIIYEDIFKFKLYTHNKFILLYVFISCLIIFILCVFIDFIRRNLFRIGSKCKLNKKLNYLIVNKE